MMRYFLATAAAALVLAAPVEAKRAARPLTPIEKLARADATVIGKVTAIEKDAVTAAPAPGAPEKVTYRVAVMKVEAALAGGANATHVKIGFVPPPQNAPPVRGGFGPVVLAEGTEGLFYLTRHHSGEFYTISPVLAPTETAAENYKDQVAQAKRGAAVLADPAKALKVDKAADRSFAAVVLLTKYRTYPETAGEVTTVKVPAEESKLILKGLAEGNWKPDPNDATAPNAYQLFSQLGLTDKDGWKPVAPKPGEDYIDKTRDAFVTWLDGPGKGYQISKFARK